MQARMAFIFVLWIIQVSAPRIQDEKNYLEKRDKAAVALKSYASFQYRRRYRVLLLRVGMFCAPKYERPSYFIFLLMIPGKVPNKFTIVSEISALLICIKATTGWPSILRSVTKKIFCVMRTCDTVASVYTATSGSPLTTRSRCSVAIIHPLFVQTQIVNRIVNLPPRCPSGGLRPRGRRWACTRRARPSTKSGSAASTSSSSSEASSSSLSDRT